MHHGVDGQKWGVKHGPPYPLDDSQSTGSRLKKGAKAKSGRGKHIAKSAAAGAALGGVVGTLAFGPVSGIASAGASALASTIRASWNTRDKKAKGNKKTKKADKYEAQRKEREENYRKRMDQYKDPEFRKKKYASAKNEDRWDDVFLEMYSPNANDWNTEAALKEYKKYLNDPEKWMSGDR